jgi:hypothetical protein
VVNCSLLPEISLRCRQRPVTENLVGTNRVRQWSLPVRVKTKDWKRRFKERKMKRIAASKETQTDLVENVEGADEFIGERVSIQKAGLPRMATSNWPPEIYEWVTDSGRHGKKYKRLKVEELRKMLVETGRGTAQHPAKSSLHLPTNINHSVTINHPTVLADKKFSPLLDSRQENGESCSLYNHLVPYLEKLDLNNYTPGTSYKYSNRHSENILKIMMGQGESGRVAEARPDSSQLGSGQPSPAPPREEDSTFTMDAFWADLGVEAPPPPTRRGSQARSFASSDQEDIWDGNLFH